MKLKEWFSLLSSSTVSIWVINSFRSARNFFNCFSPNAATPAINEENSGTSNLVEISHSLRSNLQTISTVLHVFIRDVGILGAPDARKRANGSGGAFGLIGRYVQATEEMFPRNREGSYKVSRTRLKELSAITKLLEESNLLNQEVRGSLGATEKDPADTSAK